MGRISYPPHIVIAFFDQLWIRNRIIAVINALYDSNICDATQFSILSIKNNVNYISPGLNLCLVFVTYSRFLLYKLFLDFISCLVCGW